MATDAANSAAFLPQGCRALNSLEPLMGAPPSLARSHRYLHGRTRCTFKACIDSVLGSIAKSPGQKACAGRAAGVQVETFGIDRDEGRALPSLDAGEILRDQNP